MQIRMDEKGRILFMATYVISDIHGEYIQPFLCLKFSLHLS
jgi:hypothetical protein